MSNQDDTPRFHSITVSGAPDGEILTVIDMMPVVRPERDVTLYRRFLGDPPVVRPDGSCTYCGVTDHVLFGEPVTARWYHATTDSGFFSDEVPAVAS